MTLHCAGGFTHYIHTRVRNREGHLRLPLGRQHTPPVWGRSSRTRVFHNTLSVGLKTYLYKCFIIIIILTLPPFEKTWSLDYILYIYIEHICNQSELAVIRLSTSGLPVRSFLSNRERVIPSGHVHTYCSRVVF